MATSFALEVDPRQKKDGNYSARIRVYHNSQKASIPLPYSLAASQLKVRTKEIKDPEVLADFGTQVGKWQAMIRKMGFQATRLSAKELVEKLSKDEEEQARFTWCGVAEKYLSHLEGKVSPHTLYNYKDVVRFFRVHKLDAPIEELTVEWLQDTIKRYEELQLKPKTTKGHMSIVKCVCNYIEDITYGTGKLNFRSPFRFTTAIKVIEQLNHNSNYQVKRSIKLESLRTLARLEVEDLIPYKSVESPSMYQAVLDLFKISMLMQGANIIDIVGLSKENISEDGKFVSFVRKKTARKKPTAIDIAITPELHEIFVRKGVYEGKIQWNYEYFETCSHASRLCGYTYPTLSKAVGEKVVHYSIRKTLATLIYDRVEGLGYSEKLASNFLSHSVNQGVTGEYIDLISVRDKNAMLNRQLIDLILYNKRPTPEERISL